MIDLKCHVLDGSACGPTSFDDSVEMCRSAARAGVSTLVATPRWKAGSDSPPLPITDISVKIRRLIEETGGVVNIRAGFTLEFSPSLPQLVERHGRKLTLGGKDHLLVSLPKTSLPAESVDIWEAIALRGLSVVVSSPECNLVLRNNPPVLDDWHSRGVKFLFEAGSVAGVHGREVQKFAISSLQRFEGSAAVASNLQGGRRSSMKQAHVELANRLGSARALKFVRGTPLVMLGEPDLYLSNQMAGKGPRAGLLSLLQPVGDART